MALSIVPLVSPLYAIHQVMEDLHVKYENRVFLESLIMYGLSGDQVNYNLPAASATPQVVADAVVSIFDEYVDFHNTRVNINKKKNGEIGLAKSYYTAFVLMALIVMILVGLFGVMSIRGIFPKGTGDDKHRNFDNTQINQLSFWIATCFIVLLVGIYVMTIGGMFLSRSTKISNTFNNTSFVIDDTNTTQLSYDESLGNLIKNLNPRTMVENPMSMNGVTQVLTYNDLELENDETTGFKAVIYAHVQFAKGAISQEAYKIILRKVQATLTSSPTLTPLSILFTGSIGSANPGTPALEAAVSWHPDRLRKSILKLDVYGQVSKLSDSIAYFNKLLNKEYNVSGSPQGLSDEQTSLIKDNITELFHYPIATSSNLTYYDAPGGYVTLQGETTSNAAISACVQYPNIIASSFGMSNNLPNIKVFDDLSVAGGNAVKLQYVTGVTTSNLFVMKGIPNVSYQIVSGYTDISHSPSLSNYARTSKAGLIQNNNLCLMSSSNMCVTRFQIDGSNMPYSTHLGVSKCIDPLPPSPYLTAQISAANLVRQENGDISFGEVIMKYKPYYVGVIIGVLQGVDVKGVFDINSIKDEIVARCQAFSTDELYNRNVRDVLGEVDLYLKNAKQRQAQRASQSSGKDADEKAKYVDVADFAKRISEWSEVQFFEEYIGHCANVAGCSSGLWNIYKYYDITDDILKRTKTILNTCSLAIITLLIVWVLYVLLKDGLWPWQAKCQQVWDTTSLGPLYEMRHEPVKDPNEAVKYKCFPKQGEKKLEKKAWDDVKKEEKDTSFELLVNYFMSKILIVCGIALVLVFINAYKNRIDAITTYNKRIMDKNASTVVLGSKELLGYLYSSIEKSSLVTITNNWRIDTNLPDAYERLRDNVILADDLKIDATRLDVTFLHGKMIECIEAYNKGNALTMGLNTNIPFPTYEVTIYVVILCITLVVVGIIFMQLRPDMAMESVKFYSRLKDQLKANVLVHPSELGFDCHNAQGGKAKAKKIEYVAKGLGLVFIPVVTAIIGGNMMGQSRTLQTSLYSSDMYRRQMVYNL